MDLTPRVIESVDDERYDRDAQKIRRVVVVTFKLGELGPFREEFDHDAFSETALRERMDRKAAAFRGVAR